MEDENAVIEILTQAANLFNEKGIKPNLAELKRKTGLTRGKLRTWQDHGYVWVKVETRGRKKGSKKLEGFTGVIDSHLRSNITNAVIIHEKLTGVGFTGGISIVRDYITEHKKDLVPAERAVAVQNENKSKGTRYTTGPGECFQMDWGFVNVNGADGNEWQCACFAMVCHHCGMRYIEFFPNAKQENLFIGILHAFSVMGIPEYVLTDNMRSVVIGRDVFGNPIFNHDYDAFQNTFGFKTRLCKVAHPFTKGAVERLVRFVKDNFIQGRTFVNLSDLNKSALEWCYEKNSIIYKDRDAAPLKVHYTEGCTALTDDRATLLIYLAPLRSISFDGYVNYEGRKFGVPFSYKSRRARVMRKGEKLYVLDKDTFNELSSFDVDWSKKPKNCEGQWSIFSITEQPEEHPTMPVTVAMTQVASPVRDSRFARFSITKDEESSYDK